MMDRSSNILTPAVALGCLAAGSLAVYTYYSMQKPTIKSIDEWLSEAKLSSTTVKAVLDEHGVVDLAELRDLLAADKQCAVKLFSGLKTMEKSRLKTALSAIGFNEVVEDSEELFKQGERWYGGCGRRVDYTKAVQCFQQASEAGHAAATAALGWCHLLGRGVSQSEDKAQELCKRALEELELQAKADQGHAGAQNNLGLMHEYGKGVEQDARKAVGWYRRGAEQGHPQAQNNLAIMLDFGIGVEADKDQALDWFRKSADQGFAPGQFMLASKLANGAGTQKDEALAAELWQRAADQGHARAQFQLAGMYSEGRGVEKDETKALSLYQEAAAQGHQQSKQAMALLQPK